MLNYYTTIQGDTWDKISKSVYGDEKHADYLMQANYDNLERFVFISGIRLRVPELPEEVNLNIPEWRMQ